MVGNDIAQRTFVRVLMIKMQEVWRPAFEDPGFLYRRYGSGGKQRPDIKFLSYLDGKMGKGNVAAIHGRVGKNPSRQLFRKDDVQASAGKRAGKTKPSGARANNSHIALYRRVFVHSVSSRRFRGMRANIMSVTPIGFDLDQPGK